MKKHLLTIAALFFTSLLFSQDYNLTFRSHLAFTGEASSNICGYAANGHEYALVGTQGGMHIVDVTNPDLPVDLQLIPGNNSQWREVKVWKHFAYVTTEANNGGLQIVDMSTLPTTAPFVTYTGDGAIAGKVSRIHALHIDTTAGFVHLFGCRMSDGEAIGDLVLDLKSNPMAPVYVGKWTTDYIHDGYVDNDTLYGGHI